MHFSVITVISGFIKSVLFSRQMALKYQVTVMNLGSVGTVLKITSHVSHWIQLKLKGYLVHYQNKLIYLKVIVSPSVEPVTERIANPNVDQNVFNVNLFFIKNAKNTLISIPLFASFVIRKHSPLQIQILETSQTSLLNYLCSCLKNNKLKNNSEDFMNKIINLKELNFDKNQNYSKKTLMIMLLTPLTSATF